MKLLHVVLPVLKIDIWIVLFSLLYLSYAFYESIVAFVAESIFALWFYV
ncbi:protein of unknown function [Maridesulfovibrio hydrothermalis AM13 = DSM 14728]|uniref:Uncharacterized protein n=1 Tax=Maridesulfovibrio hydrothermalis AM13 = DSM 14728 TaxID=1121451 RepID=L0R824_9BACT|nr:protein of unknown function [Maridesulfovibrio hydrothermalis AM13 = DSM 14728]